MKASDVDKYRVIDTDAHVIEPYDLWTSRLSVKKWGDKVPHVRFDKNFQEDAWYFGDERVGAGAGQGVRMMRCSMARATAPERVSTPSFV